jgi:NAD(P)-dependent dehydrogenase (short-subunit alcohol dehydrogenase family)
MMSDVAIVTGGSRGIGLATVRRLASEKVRVAFCGRDREAGADAERTLQDEGFEVFFHACDVGDESQVRNFVDRCRQQYGAPGILVNNAGVNANFDAETMSTDEWDRFFATDLKSAWLVSKCVLPDMRELRAGSIVNVSSIHGFVTLDGFFPYAAAKSGLVGLTRSLALDYGAYNVRVNCVAPGFVRTRLVQQSIERSADHRAAERDMVGGVALNRIGEPEEIANVVAFFASKQSSYVTGSTLLVDGGLTARRAG